MPFVSALLVQSIFLKENQKGDCWVQSIYKPAVFFKENQKGDAYSAYPGVFTRWILGLWFSLKVHGLQIGAPWPQNSEKKSESPTELKLGEEVWPNLLSSLGLTIFMELFYVEEVAPRFGEIQGRKTAADSRH